MIYSKTNFATLSAKSKASAWVASPFSSAFPSSSRIVTCTFATLTLFTASLILRQMGMTADTRERCFGMKNRHLFEYRFSKPFRQRFD